MPGIIGPSGVSSLPQVNAALHGASVWSSHSADKAYLRESIRPLAASLLQERHVEKTWSIGPLTVRYESVEGAGQQSKNAVHDLALIAESLKARLPGDVFQSGMRSGSNAAAPVEVRRSPAFRKSWDASGVAASFEAVLESGGEAVFAASSEIAAETAAGRKGEWAGGGIWNSSVAAAVTKTVVALDEGNRKNAMFQFDMPEAGVSGAQLPQNFAKKSIRAIHAYMETAARGGNAVQCMPAMAV